MLAHLADISIRSLALAAVAAILVWRRRAALEHAVWAAVAAGMLVLLVFGEALPKLPLKVLEAPAAPPLQEAAHVPHFALSMPRDNPVPAHQPSAPRRDIDWFIVGYAAISLVFLLRFGVGMLLARRLIRTSQAVEGFRELETIAVPLTVGWLRPVIVLPVEWREWERTKLAAVLSHEEKHARRRDGLVLAMASINRCLFWFHPLAWWLERRLALLAELACDEACVAETGDCRGYASLLVEMAQAVDGSRGRLREHALTMAAGSHVKRRVESILTEDRRFSRGLSATGWAAIALCAVPVICAAGTLTLERQAPLLPLKLPPVSAPAPPMLVAQARPEAPARPVQVPAKRAEFEVASIREAPPRPNGRQCSPADHRFTVDADRVDISCVSLQGLMEYAFQLPQKQVDGPDWMHYHAGPKFDISAKLPQGSTKDQIPEMLQALLVDRFKLVYHFEHREQNVDALVVAPEGLKLEEVSPPASASTAEPAAAPDAPSRIETINGILTQSNPKTDTAGPSQTNSRMSDYRQTMPSRDTIRWEFSSTTIEGLADQMADRLKRPVLDMTGLKGRYRVVLDVKTAQYDPADFAAINTIGDANAVIDNMLTELRDHFQKELEKSGLQLVMRKAPVEYVVLDRIEQKPTNN